MLYRRVLIKYLALPKNCNMKIYDSQMDFLFAFEFTFPGTRTEKVYKGAKFKCNYKVHQVDLVWNEINYHTAKIMNQTCLYGRVLIKYLALQKTTTRKFMTAKWTLYLHLNLAPLYTFFVRVPGNANSNANRKSIWLS